MNDDGGLDLIFLGDRSSSSSVDGPSNPSVAGTSNTTANIDSVVTSNTSTFAAVAREVDNTVPSDITPKGATKLKQRFEGYTFPKHADGRSFQPNWLKTFDWLEYSKEKNAVYCFPCRQYAGTNASDTFCVTGFNNWSKALAKGQGLKKHEASNIHLLAMVSWKEHSSRSASNQEISSLLNDTVLEKRRFYVKEIISTVLFLVKNELPFRGNWNNEDKHESGLFNNLFKHLLERDEHLRKCQEAMPKNALYTSPKIQNELIYTIADWLRQSIVTEVNEASYATIFADGTTDRNGDEILSIAFRYVLKDEPIETLICFEKADDKTANGFFRIIINRMQELGVDLARLLLSQCYDGAAVNSGEHAGLQVLIQNHFNRKIPYVHCISHRLHLVVMEIVKKMTMASFSSTKSNYSTHFSVALKFVNCTKVQAFLCS